MINKEYKDMTKQERKEYYGYAFKRKDPVDYPEIYICNVDINTPYSGFGCYPDGKEPVKYKFDDVKQYLKDYPEMDCKGWYAPYTDNQSEYIKFRTQFVFKESSEICKYMYETLLYKFINDDIWQGINENSKLIDFYGTAITCDRASEFYIQYLGDDDEKADMAKQLKNEAKTYIRNCVDKFIEEHKDKPEFPDIKRDIII